MSDISEFELEITKNLLQGHNCDNCQKCHHYFTKDNGYTETCQKPERAKYSTCLDWEEKSMFASLILPVVRRVYPTQIANDIVSVQPMQAPNNKVFYINPKYTNHGSGVTLDEQEPEMTDEQKNAWINSQNMTSAQKKRKRKPRHNLRSTENHLLKKWSNILEDIPEDKAKNIATILESQEKYLKRGTQ